ncbi:MAG: hypothetical protein L6R36_000228 [Xanthoria steineri]|nr:MAG: hypothetical protein L6R36_000228 [Xanthoria steineri]
MAVFDIGGRCGICVVLSPAVDPDSQKSLEEWLSHSPPTSGGIFLQAFAFYTGEIFLTENTSLVLINRYTDSSRSSRSSAGDKVVSTCSEEISSDRHQRLALNAINPVLTRSESSLKVADDWLKECTSSHSGCNIGQSDYWIPKRLLDIGSLTTDLVSLKPKEALPENSRYMALSYCWGATSFFQLSKDSFPMLLDGVSPEEFPKTIQDAIEVTRCLGVRYLWVDSLCMFQDSKGSPSWLDEGLQMDKVYAHCYATIAAACARTANEGMFRKRVLDYVKLQLPAHSLGDRRSLTLPTKFVVVDRNIEDNFGLAPLRERAWAVQERFMAPRILHFAQRELFWQCKTHFASESWPSLKDGNALHISVSETNFKQLNSIQEGCSPNCHEAKGCSVLRAWVRVAETYSAGALSRADDKLIALAGMAKCFAPLFGSAYLAGLWKRHLPYLLLWRAEKPLRLSRPATYRAPSCCWTAIDAKISYSYLCYSMCELDGFEILDAHVEAAGASDDLFGPVKGGYIRMRTRLRRLRAHFLYKTRYGQVISMCSQYLDRPDATISLHVEDDIINTTTPEGVFVVMANTQSKRWCEGIVLSCTNIRTGCFRRFGHFHFQRNCMQGDYKNVEWLDKDEAELPCIEYDAETRLHTILIE